MTEWIDVNDRLPEDKEYVFIYAGNYMQSMKYAVAMIVKGISKEERQLMIDGKLPNPDTTGYTGRGQHKINSKRSNDFYASDEHGNNLKPYNWDTFGAKSYFGQQVTHWMPLPNPPKK